MFSGERQVIAAPQQEPYTAFTMPDQSADRDLPLKDDTRLLGRLLGDVLRAQTGDGAFERVEAIRQTAIRFRRADANEAAAVRRELSGLLNDLAIADTLNVVRAFSYFSHLANIAEDVHQNRRRRAHALAGSPPQRGRHQRRAGAPRGRRRVAGGARGIGSREALVSPVLTAHPTEVQRKSILDCEREIVRLLTWRDRTQLTPDDEREFEAGLYRQVLVTVADGDAAAVETRRARRDRQRPRVLPLHVPRRRCRASTNTLTTGIARTFGTMPPMPPFLRMGSWIGGDRDGNPFVDGRLRSNMRSARRLPSRSSTTCDRCTGSAPSCRCRPAWCSRRRALLALAAARTTAIRTAQDEPYRQALTGIYARLAATRARSLAGAPCSRRRYTALPAYATAATSFIADLEVIAASLATHGAALLGTRRLAPLIRAVDDVRLSPASLDLRQNADVHEAVLADLLARAGVVPDYLALRRTSGSRVLARELATPRPLALRAPRLQRAHARGACDPARRRGRPPPLRRARAAQLRDLEVPVGVRSPRGRRAAEGSRPAARRARSPMNIVPLFETIDDLARCGAIMRDAFALPLYRRWLAGRGDWQEVMLGLLRQQQGRRLPDRQLGAVPRGDAARGGVRRARRQAAALPRPRRHRGPRRRAVVRGDPRAAGRQRHAAGCASPSRARSSPASTPIPNSAGATSRRWSRRRWRRASPMPRRSASAPARITRRSTSCRRSRSPPIARWCTRHAEFVAYFRGATPIAEIAELNIGSRPASRTASTRIEDLRAIPWVFSWGQCRLMLPGWYGFGTRGRDLARRRRRRAWRSCARCTSSGRSSAACCRTWRWCSPRPTSRSRRATRSWCPTPRCASRCSRASRPSTAVPSARMLAITGHDELLGRQPDARAQHPQPLPLPRSAQPSAGGAPAPSPRGADRRADEARDPPHDQRSGRGLAQQRLTRVAAGPQGEAAAGLGSKASNNNRSYSY